LPVLVVVVIAAVALTPPPLPLLPLLPEDDLDVRPSREEEGARPGSVSSAGKSLSDSRAFRASNVWAPASWCGSFRSTSSRPPLAKPSEGVHRVDAAVAATAAAENGDLRLSDVEDDDDKDSSDDDDDVA
jgi:hypothetical protein